MDQKLSLSTHILDTTKGKPADNVKVRLFKLVGGVWVESNFDGATDKDGRIKDFSRIDGSALGIYKLRFEVGAYFERMSSDTLYPFIEVSVERSRIKSVLQNFFTDCFQHYIGVPLSHSTSSQPIRLLHISRFIKL